MMCNLSYLTLAIPLLFIHTKFTIGQWLKKSLFNFLECEMFAVKSNGVKRRKC